MAEDAGELLLERFRNGDADPDELRELEAQLEADPRLRRKLVQDVFLDLNLYKVCGASKPSEEAPARKRHGTKQGPAVEPTRSHTVVWWCAAAASLLITAGLLALWLVPGPLDRPLTRQEQRRSQIIIDQLYELKLERAAVGAEEPSPTPGTAPDSVLPDAATRSAQQREAREAALFIEARQRFTLQQLRTYQGRRPLPDDLDVDEFSGKDTGKPVIAQRGPIEVGHVLLSEDGNAGVILRETDKEPNRLALTKGLALLNGDRIETAPGDRVARASVQLDGGATLDLDGSTSIDVLGRDNLRLNAGRIYAHIAVPILEESDRESGPPFSLQTEAGRFLTHDLRAEIQLSARNVPHRELAARVDSGKVHLVNQKGHSVGRKGQELRVLKDTKPTRLECFSEHIWRGRNLSHPGLPLGKGNPVLLSNDDTDLNFSAEYALALAHTGEIDLRGIQITHQILDKQGLRGDPDTAQQTRWRDMVREIATLRQTGLHITIQPALGAVRSLQRPASGRYEDTIPERSPAVDQLLAEARKATPERPLVVVASGAYTDMASAWLLDRGIPKRTVVITRDGFPRGIKDGWAFTIVLEKYPCVICNVPFPQNGLQQFAQLAGSRWGVLAARARPADTDFSQFACVTVPGFVQSTERVRFVHGTSRDLTDFTFKPDPHGQTWLVKRADAQLLVQEFTETFLTGSNVP